MDREETPFNRAEVGLPEGQEEASPITETEMPEDEKTRRARLMRHFIEYRVLGINPVYSEEESEDIFGGLSVAEKANLLYEKILARQATLRTMERQEAATGATAPAEEVDPDLLSDIQALWSDKGVQELFIDRYTDARMDAKAYRLSDLGRDWEDLNIVIEVKQGQLKRISQDLFLQRITREDRLSAARSRVARLARELIEKRQTRDDIVSLKGLPAIPENTDVAAHIHYEHLREMRNQSESGSRFVWLPYYEGKLRKITAALQNGRWPILMGEGGTGKSHLAIAAAYALTGSAPLKVPCGPRTNEHDLIMDKDIKDTDQGGGSKNTYGGLLKAATGFDDSTQLEPTCDHGRIVRLDEFNRIDPKGQGYSIVKEARQLHPGEMYYDHPVLPGFGAIAT
ncbi:AAA family ATPase, partial [Patescibacteria group bacterium]|nr:AAA family ATPase [Patescibacteria group bacterium]